MNEFMCHGSVQGVMWRIGHGKVPKWPRTPSSTGYDRLILCIAAGADVIQVGAQVVLVTKEKYWPQAMWRRPTHIGKLIATSVMSVVG